MKDHREDLGGEVGCLALEVCRFVLSLINVRGGGGGIPQ